MATPDAAPPTALPGQARRHGSRRFARGLQTKLHHRLQPHHGPTPRVASNNAEMGAPGCPPHDRRRVRGLQDHPRRHRGVLREQTASNRGVRLRDKCVDGDGESARGSVPGHARRGARQRRALLHGAEGVHASGRHAGGDGRAGGVRRRARDVGRIGVVPARRERATDAARVRRPHGRGGGARRRRRPRRLLLRARRRLPPLGAAGGHARRPPPPRPLLGRLLRRPWPPRRPHRRRQRHCSGLRRLLRRHTRHVDRASLTHQVRQFL